MFRTYVNALYVHYYPSPAKVESAKIESAMTELERLEAKLRQIRFMKGTNRLYDSAPGLSNGRRAKLRKALFEADRVVLVRRAIKDILDNNGKSLFYT